MTCETKVFGTSMYSLVELSVALQALNVSHMTQTGNTRIEFKTDRVQSARVVLVDTPSKVVPSAVNFMVSSLAQLNLTTCSRLKVLPIVAAIREALTRDEEPPPFEVITLSAMDYVNLIAKPSKLNLIQTELLKVQPYSLRKEANAAMLKFFRGSMSAKQAHRLMRRSSKLTKLWEIVQSYSELKEAVQRMGEETPEQISLSTGIPTFELMYVTKAKL